MRISAGWKKPINCCQMVSTHAFVNNVRHHLLDFQRRNLIDRIQPSAITLLCL